MSNPHNYQFLRDPLKLIKVLWPDVKLYDRQKEVMYSVWHNRHTIVVAGNMLGKDYVSALIALTFFLTRSPCHIVTTSVDGTQLEGVLWGEIRSLLQQSKIPLDSTKGGPLLINHLHIRKVFTSGPMKGQIDGLSYLLGRVAAKGEGMLGHHIAEQNMDDTPRTLFIGDEASGIDPLSIERADTWADRMLLIGNPYPCTNYFYTGSEEGDVLAKGDVKDIRGVTLGESEKRIEQYKRKVIRIRCDESPNVRYAQAQVAKGMEPTGEMLVPGVMSYWKYQDRRERWDKVKQCIQLDAQFYKGAELLLFPPEWLNRSNSLIEQTRGKHRTARAIGCDPGEGEAQTAWVTVDEWGVMDVFAIQTPDTSVIAHQTLALMRKWNVPAEKVMFDRGGGGTQIAHLLRSQGHNVKTVGFGETVGPQPKSGLTPVSHKIEQNEDKYAYTSRRVEMYWSLSELLDPGREENFFCIPGRYEEIRRQLAPIPKMYDKEGRAKLPPKNKTDPNSKEKTLVEIIGCSPDQADALVVAVYARDYAARKVSAGAA